jgi:hypothetical protein
MTLYGCSLKSYTQTYTKHDIGPICIKIKQISNDGVIVTPSFKAKTRCSSYVCPRSSCHTYGQNVNTETQCLYYIVSYNKKLLQVQKGVSSGKDTIMPQAEDRGFARLEEVFIKVLLIV